MEEKNPEISEEVWRGMNQLKNAVHYRRYRDGQCAAGHNDVRYCQGECLNCSYYMPSESIDYLEGRDAARNVYANAVSVEDMAISNLEVELILLKMEEILPGSGRDIGRMLMLNKTSAEISQYLGWPESTYRYRMEKVREHLLRALDLDF